MKKFPLTLLLCAACCFTAAAQSQPAGQPPDSQVVIGGAPAGKRTAELRQESFEIVWRTVKEKHFDPNFGGVDWDKVREQYAPRVGAAKSDQEFYGLLQQMLGELHQSHFNIIPPEYIIEDGSKERPTGEAGLNLQIIDGQAVITRIAPGSSAARAGLHPGFVIKKVDDTPVEQIIKRFAKSKESPALTRLRMARATLAQIDGTHGTSVRLLYLDGRDQPREAKLERERAKGELSPPLGNFPPQYTEFEAKRLAGNIGYIRFNIFVVPLMDKIRAAIREMSDAPGLIIDLRGNPGGLGGMSSGIAGLLETRQTSLGTMRMRTGYQHFAVFPQPDPYTGPVAILIDGGSASTSEIFAAGMQEIGRAMIVGEQSAGAALPSIFFKLPTGALFQYAFADLKTPKGVLIEGRGVAPDVEVKLSRALLLKQSDPQLDAAVEQVLKHSRPPKGR